MPGPPFRQHVDVSVVTRLAVRAGFRGHIAALSRPPVPVFWLNYDHGKVWASLLNATRKELGPQVETSADGAFAWAIGAVVARFVHTEEVTGSNPVSPTRIKAPLTCFQRRERGFFVRVAFRGSPKNVTATVPPRPCRPTFLTVQVDSGTGNGFGIRVDYCYQADIWQGRTFRSRPGLSTVAPRRVHRVGRW